MGRSGLRPGSPSVLRLWRRCDGIGTHGLSRHQRGRAAEKAFPATPAHGARTGPLLGAAGGTRKNDGKLATQYAIRLALPPNARSSRSSAKALNLAGQSGADGENYELVRQAGASEGRNGLTGRRSMAAAVGTGARQNRLRRN